jgi:SAM-dependent methyltransferase
MNETSKSRKLPTKGSIEEIVLRGNGIDIGPADDAVTPNVRRFDMEHGDANVISQFVKEQFDFVYASHCLEHMHKPREAVLEWWKLVKPGGHLFFAVPDEDLYEQGVFPPSRFNPDHKATFTISKTKSWSPLSINVLDLAQSLPGGIIMKIALQDHNYDRSFHRHGPRRTPGFIMKNIIRGYYGLERRGIRLTPLRSLVLRYQAVDQTKKDDTLAQIVCIVKKIV